MRGLLANAKIKALLVQKFPSFKTIKFLLAQTVRSQNLIRLRIGRRKKCGITFACAKRLTMNCTIKVTSRLVANLARVLLAQMSTNALVVGGGKRRLKKNADYTLAM